MPWRDSVIRGLLRALLAAVLFAVASAACASGTCSPASSGIAFGDFNGSQITVTGTITLTCTGAGNFDVDVKLSTGNSLSYATRLLSNGAQTLTYNLYRDSAFAQIWGDGTGGSNIVTAKVQMLGNPTATVNVPLYAKLPAQVVKPSGIYSDTIVATAFNNYGTFTGSFPVKAQIQPLCTISATDLLFGSYAGAQLDQQSQISVTCSSGVSWNVGLNAGTFPGATVTTRKMSGPGSSSMAYSLYRNSTRTLNWGNTVGTDTLSGTGTGTVQTPSVYGRIPASQSLPPGNYQDQIIATVTF